MLHRIVLFFITCSLSAQQAEGLTIADAYLDVMNSDYVDGVISLMKSGANPNEKIPGREETLLDQLAQKRINFGYCVHNSQHPAAGNYWIKAQKYNKAITLVLAGGAIHTKYFLVECWGTVDGQRFLKTAIEDYNCQALWYNAILPKTLDGALAPFNVALVVVEIIQDYLKNEIVPVKEF